LRGERPIIEIFPYFSRSKGATAFKLKKATAPDPWRAELVNSVIELKLLHGPGYPRSEDGELLVLNDGDEIGDAIEENIDGVADMVDEMFDALEAGYNSDESELDGVQ
jgi:hypothetical protein